MSASKKGEIADRVFKPPWPSRATTENTAIAAVIENSGICAESPTVQLMLETSQGVRRYSRGSARIAGFWRRAQKIHRERANADATTTWRGDLKDVDRHRKRAIEGASTKR